MDKIVSFDCERTFPRDFPAGAKDLVTRLMDPNPETRLGGGGRGLAEVKVSPVHPWGAVRMPSRGHPPPPPRLPNPSSSPSPSLPPPAPRAWRH